MRSHLDQLSDSLLPFPFTSLVVVRLPSFHPTLDLPSAPLRFVILRELQLAVAKEDPSYVSRSRGLVYVYIYIANHLSLLNV